MKQMEDIGYERMMFAFRGFLGIISARTVLETLLANRVALFQQSSGVNDDQNREKQLKAVEENSKRDRCEHEENKGAGGHGFLDDLVNLIVASGCLLQFKFGTVAGDVWVNWLVG